MGTDEVGRDIWARVLYGGRVSLMVDLVAVAITFAIGVSLGLVSGFYGGTVDLLIQRLVEIVAAIPALILIISMVAVLGSNIVNVMVILGLTGWTGLCRFVRGQVLSVRQQRPHHLLPRPAQCGALHGRSVGVRSGRLHFSGDRSELPWSRGAAADAELGKPGGHGGVGREHRETALALVARWSGHHLRLLQRNNYPERVWG